jgi:hypothetical protein
MAVSEAQLAEASAWLDQHTAAAERIKEASTKAGISVYLGFNSYYEAAAVAKVAAEAAQISSAGQDVIAGSAQQFIANIVALLKGTPVRIPRTTQRPIRNGAPLPLVHTRPAEAYRKAVATGKTHDEAVAIALKRAADIQVADLSLAERAAQQSLMEELGITEFRRIVRPELSKTGSCGLCIVAADRIYSVATLMPIHPPSCNCVTMPIIGDDDPGHSLNKADLKRLYADAGSNKADDLRRTRYTVNEHGEYGPTIAKEGDSFRGPSNVALEDDPERAARMLAKTLPVLERLEAAGGPAGPLQYQRDLVARLTAIAGA